MFFSLLYFVESVFTPCCVDHQVRLQEPFMDAAALRPCQVIQQRPLVAIKFIKKEAPMS